MKLSTTDIFVFDTETTGVDPLQDRIVELGAARVIDGRVDQLYRYLVNPGVPIPAGAAAVHGITDENVLTAPTFTRIAPTLLHSLNVFPLYCGYNAVAFDTVIINAELERVAATTPLTDLNPKLPSRLDVARVLDVFIFVRWYFRHLPKRTLGAVCEHFGVPLVNAHSAAADAQATGRLLMALITNGTIPDDVDAALAEQARLLPLLEAEFAKWSYWLYADRTTGVVHVGAGKHAGTPLANTPASYLDYIAELPDTAPGVKAEIQAELVRRDAARPAAQVIWD